jgi:hypothetical protein
VRGKKSEVRGRKSVDRRQTTDKGRQRTEIGDQSTGDGRQRRCTLFVSFHPETLFLDVILRSKATKNLMVKQFAEILRGVYPEPAEKLRMT